MKRDYTKTALALMCAREHSFFKDNFKRSFFLKLLLNLVFTGFIIGLAQTANAQFTPGRLVVVQTLETSATSFSSKEGAPVTLNEYTTTTTGTPTYSVSLPSI